MDRRRQIPTGFRRRLHTIKSIVGKTCLKDGAIRCNDMLKRIGGYSESLTARPSSIPCHANVQQCVFKSLWDAFETSSKIHTLISRVKSGYADRFARA